MVEIYEKLRQKIDQHPMGAPKDETILTILAGLFTLEEARLAVSMTLKGMTAGEIGDRAGVAESEAAALLESMADKGVVYCAKSKGLIRYALMPPMPGFFEFSLARGEETPENRRLAGLWEEYFTRALGKVLHGTNVPMSRVIAVNKSVPVSLEVFPYERSVEIIKSCRNIALAKCQCRFTARNCDAPLDVCLMLDGWADFTIDRGLARGISEQEALKALDRAAEAGLISITSNNQGSVPYICNCCPCCCFMLRGVTELKRKTLASSRFMAVVDQDACIGCEECVAVCAFKAIDMNDQDVARVSPEDCLGCGHCTTVCPEGAIIMKRNPGAPEPYDSGKSLQTDIAKDKNKLDSYKY